MENSTQDHARLHPRHRLGQESAFVQSQILQATLSNFKGEREKKGMQGRALVEFPHARYESLQTQYYYISKEVCSSKERMSKLSQDDSISIRSRYCPISRYYSMLVEDTPGYIRSEVNPKSFEHKPNGKFHPEGY